MPIAHLQICKGIYSIYLPIPTMLPPFNWVTINPYISRKVVLFSLLNDGPWRGLNHGPLDPQSPALPSELSAIDTNSCILGPSMWTVSNKQGCLPISLKWTNFNFFQQFFCTKSNFKDAMLMEKITSHVIWALWGGPFWLCPCLLTGQIWSDQNFRDHFEF